MYPLSLSLSNLQYRTIWLSGSTANPVMMPTQTRTPWTTTLKSEAITRCRHPVQPQIHFWWWHWRCQHQHRRCSALSTTSSHHRTASITTSAGGGVESTPRQGNRTITTAPSTTSSSQPFITNTACIEIRTSWASNRLLYYKATSQRPNGYIRSNQSRFGQLQSIDSEVNPWRGSPMRVICDGLSLTALYIWSRYFTKWKLYKLYFTFWVFCSTAVEHPEVSAQSALNDLKWVSPHYCSIDYYNEYVLISFSIPICLGLNWTRSVAMVEEQLWCRPQEELRFYVKIIIFLQWILIINSF